MYPRGHVDTNTSQNQQLMPITNDDLYFIMVSFKDSLTKMTPGLNVLGVQQVRGS